MNKELTAASSGRAAAYPASSPEVWRCSLGPAIYKARSSAVRLWPSAHRMPAGLSSPLVSRPGCGLSRFSAPKVSRRHPGPMPRSIAPALAERVRRTLWWGYKLISRVWCRQALAVSSRFVYLYRVLKETGPLRQRRPRGTEIDQADRPFELLLLPPNELRRAGVICLHISGQVWRCATTTVGYYRHSLLALHCSPSHNTESERPPGSRQLSTSSDQIIGATLQANFVEQSQQGSVRPHRTQQRRVIEGARRPNHHQPLKRQPARTVLGLASGSERS